MSPQSIDSFALVWLFRYWAWHWAEAIPATFFTRKIFLEDFNVMNPFYKQTLFLMGKGERDKAITNYGQLVYLQRG
jgi:hypothetical protein